MKATALWKTLRVRHAAGDHVESCLLLGKPRHAVHQSLRVGMQGIGEHGIYRGVFDDAPGVHHVYVVGDLGHDA